MEIGEWTCNDQDQGMNRTLLQRKSPAGFIESAKLYPLVSIIIPALNEELWIRRSIDSVLRQTWKHLEVIVVNDGSTDNTEAICRTYRNRIRYIRQEWRGVSAARNRGIFLSSGSLIGFLDADDELFPDMVDHLVKQLLRFPQAGAASGAFVLEGDYAPIRKPGRGSIFANGESSGIIHSFFDVLDKTIVCTGSMLVRREVLDQVGHFNEALHVGEDMELWCRIGGNFPWVFSDREMMIYHKNESDSEKKRIRQGATWKWILTKREMKKKILSEHWVSYRQYLERIYIKYSKNLLVKGETARAREILGTISPQVRNISWYMLSILALLPSFLVVLIVKSVITLKKGYRLNNTKWVSEHVRKFCQLRRAHSPQMYED